MSLNQKAVDLLGALGNPMRALAYIQPTPHRVIAVLRSNHAPHDRFDVATAFQIDGKWHASMALHNGSFAATLSKLADLINP